MQHFEERRLSCGEALLIEPQRGLRGIERGALRGQCLRIVLERTQIVGDLLERSEHRLPVQRELRRERVDASATLRFQRAAVEDGCGELRRHRPDAVATLEERAKRRGVLDPRCGERDLRIKMRGRDADGRCWSTTIRC